MQAAIAERFVEALRTLEQSGDAEPLISLFAEDCELSNLALHRVFRGKDGAREFWREYHGTLTEVTSRFRNIIAAGNRVALEWVTQGKAFSGDDIEYEGVSILELDSEGNSVSRFMAYFNPTRLGSELKARAPRSPQSASGGAEGAPQTSEGAAADLPRSQVPATAPA